MEHTLFLFLFLFNHNAESHGFSTACQVCLCWLPFFLSLVEQVESIRPTFEFTPCVGGCILNSNCLPNNGNCMCRRVRGDFLEKVLKCMDTNCHANLSNYEDSFLDPLEDGCDERDQDIPNSKLKAAKVLANSLLSKSSVTTTTANLITASPGKVTPTPTTVETRPSSSSQEGESPNPITTSTADRNIQSGSTSTSDNVPASSVQTATPSPSPDADAIPPPLTDASPFTNNNLVSTGSQTQPISIILWVSLAAAILWAGL